MKLFKRRKPLGDCLAYPGKWHFAMDEYEDGTVKAVFTIPLKDNQQDTKEVLRTLAAVAFYASDKGLK